MRWVGEQALTAYVESLQRRCLAPGSVRRNAGVVRALLRATGKPVARITRQDVRDWLAERSARGVRSTRGDLHVLCAFFAFALDLGLVRRDPTRDLAQPARAARRAQLVLGPDKVQALLVAALAQPAINRPAAVRRAVALRDRACLELLYGLGLRAAEVRSALVPDLDLAAGELLCRAAKNGPERRLPLPPASIPHLSTYLREARPLLVRPEGGDEGRLVLGVHGRPLQSQGVLRIVRAVARRAGVRASRTPSGGRSRRTSCARACPCPPCRSSSGTRRCR